ncbi:MAG TPA: JAB domain-containing protein [Allosphingosinicella sp.]|jgi:DNA repair protein RadC
MRIATLDDATALLAPFLAGAEEERVLAVHLDGDRMLLAVTFEQAGSRDDVALPLRSIAAAALRLQAAAIIVAHNHPSGDPAPSAADRDATRRLADVLRPLGIRLLDHIVFADGESRSMAAMGLL